MPRVLVTGGSGLLGRAVLKEFAKHSTWQALGLAFSRSKGQLRKVDLTQPQEVQEVVQEFKPDFVVHAAAERRPDVVEGQKEATEGLNVTATETLCKAAGAVNAPVLYMSTDYVFDGDNAPYKDTDATNPLSYYGETKLQGEKVALSINPGNLVLRVPILYGELEFVSESAVTFIFNAVKDSSKESIQDHYARRYPTDVADIASVIRQLLEKKMEDNSISGIYQWTGSECYTKYEMALAMAEVLGLSSSHIKPNASKPTGGVKRPYDAHLCREKLEKLGITQETPFREAIKACLQPYV